MRTWKFGLFAVLACLLTLVLVAPGTDARVTMQPACHWEYTVLDTRNLVVHEQITPELIVEMGRYGITAANSIEQTFDRFGAEGWELVSFADRMAVFKRQAR